MRDRGPDGGYRHVPNRLTQIFFVEVKNPLPAVSRRFHPVTGAIHRKKGMAGIVIAVKLIRLPVFFEFLLYPVHLVGRGVGIIVAK